MAEQPGIDLTRLTPAPWVAAGGEPNEDDIRSWTVFGDCRPGGSYAIAWSQPEADAKFIALTRNAFDFWIKCDPKAAMMWLTDTERWYRANVEGKGGG